MISGHRLLQSGLEGTHPASRIASRDRCACSGIPSSSIMKSAYELAMKRLQASDPDAAKPLTPEQKATLAWIDRLYQGKTAEREIFLKQQLDAMLAASKWDEAEKIKQQLASEKARLAEEKEEEKQKARRGFSGAKS